MVLPFQRPCHRASSKPARPVKLERLSRPASSKSVESKELAPVQGFGSLAPVQGVGSHVRSTSSRELNSRELNSRSRELLRLTNSSTVSESRRHEGDEAAPQPPGGAAKGGAAKGEAPEAP